MAEFPLYLAAGGVDGAKRAPVRLCFIGRKIGASVVSVAHLVGLWRGAEDVTLLARSYIEKTGLRIEAWGHPVGGAQRSWANRASLGCWRALVVRDGATVGIFAVGPRGPGVGIG